MAGLLRSPLVVFVMAGLVLFAVTRLGGDDSGEDPDDAIVVEREALLDYVQLRSAAADAAALSATWDALDPAARRVWIDRYVREEALVREARKLGLDRDDDLIRRRLVQQMEFLITAEAAGAIDDAILEAEYAARAEDHRVPAVVTFSHVFVRDDGALEGEPGDAAHGRAVALLGALNREGVPFGGAGARGDLFLYNRAYVDRTVDEVRAHFGPELAASLETLTPEGSLWQGPIASQHGWHVVLLTRWTGERVPPLEEISDALREEIVRDRRDASRERGISEIVEAYETRVANDVLVSSPQAR